MANAAIASLLEPGSYGQIHRRTFSPPSNVVLFQNSAVEVVRKGKTDDVSIANGIGDRMQHTKALFVCDCSRF